MTLIIAGPEPTAADEALFADLSARQFWMAEPGQPALVKLLNNTLGAYTALATAAMLRLAHREGLPASRLLEIVDVSSGGSWMSEHFPEFHHELLFKDVGLTRDAFGALPVIEFGDLAAHSATIEEVRGLLRADG